MEKQILAVVSFSQYKLRVLVAQFFNTKFNVLKVEQVFSEGFDGNQVVDEKALVNALRKSLAHIATNLGASITQVILCVPSVGMDRYRDKIKVVPQFATTVTNKDITLAIKKAMTSQVRADKEVIFVNINGFIAHNTVYKKLPSHPELSSVVLDIDYYVASKALTYDLAKCIEKAGIGLLDVVLDAYALGKETAAIDASLKSSVIVVEIEMQRTLLSLYYHGRLISSQWINTGYGVWAAAIVERYQLSFEVALRLMNQNVDLKSQHISSNPVFLWQNKEQTFTTNQQAIMECVESKIEQFIQEVYENCQPIFMKSSGEFILTGDGCLLEGLPDRFTKITSIPTKIYVPETIGARDPGLTQVLGALYAHKDHLLYTNRTSSCVNEVEFDTMLKNVKVSDPQDATISKKVKGFFDLKKE